MKYKLLTEKGTHFVCLEDGTKIPGQVKMTIIQYLRDVVLAQIVATQDNDLCPDGLILKQGMLFLNGVELSGTLSIVRLAAPDEQQATRVYFEVYVDLVDTIEQPKPNAH